MSIEDKKLSDEWREGKKFILSRIKKDSKGCWLWQSSIHRDGYGKLSKKPFWQAHRYSYYIFNKGIDDNLLVCHKCHVRSCVNPDHLYQGTHFDNNRHTVRDGRAKGLFEKAEKHWNAKYSETFLKIIKQLTNNFSCKEISERLSIPRTTVSSIKFNRCRGYLYE